MHYVHMAEIMKSNVSLMVDLDRGVVPEYWEAVEEILIISLCLSRKWPCHVEFPV